jgi:hypothetical protein
MSYDSSVAVQLSSMPGPEMLCVYQFKDHNAIEQLIEDLASLRPYVTRLTTYQGTSVGLERSGVIVDSQTVAERPAGQRSQRPEHERENHRFVEGTRESFRPGPSSNYLSK